MIATDSSRRSRFERVGFQVGQIDKLQRRRVGGFEDDWRRHAGIQSFLPARDAQTPPVARLQTKKTRRGHRRDQVVAAFELKRQELARNLGANHVQAMIARTGATITVAVEAGAWLAATALKFTAKNVRRHGPSLARRRRTANRRLAQGVRGGRYRSNQSANRRMSQTMVSQPCFTPWRTMSFTSRPASLARCTNHSDCSSGVSVSASP